VRQLREFELDSGAQGVVERMVVVDRVHEHCRPAWPCSEPCLLVSSASGELTSTRCHTSVGRPPRTVTVRGADVIPRVRGDS
jgi:hypothetical protein